MENKPNCYNCIHRRNVPGDCHSSCNNKYAKVSAAEHGVKKGWFAWPFNFDPVWLITCDGFEPKQVGVGMGNAPREF
jgi:hypothetical protein